VNLLVLGATGLLGTAIVPVLRARAMRVVGLSRGAEGLDSVDLSAEGRFEHHLRRVRPDAVLNLVALADVDACQRDPGFARRMNAELPGKFARACEASEVPFVHISTDMVYDGPGPHGEGQVSPCNTYALTKLEGEREVAEAGGCVLRTNFFGRSRGGTRRSFSDWIVQGIREGRDLPLLSDVLFSPLSMASLGGVLAMVLERPRRGEVLNLGSRDGTTKREFALALGEACALGPLREHPVRLAELRLEAPRPTDMRMHVARFEEAYGVRLPTLRTEIETASKEYR
jgi:dTDP-4-dehydrorhamnose reductase